MKIMQKTCQVGKIPVQDMMVATMMKRKMKAIHTSRMGGNTNGNKYKCTKCNYR